MLYLRKIKAVLFLTLIAAAPLFGQVPADAQKAQEQTQVSDADLKKFTNAYQEIQTENQNAQQQIMTAVQEEGMDVERFGEIKNASMDPNSTMEVSKEEQAKYDKANKKLEKMQSSFQQKMEKIIVSHGLTTDKFDQIFLAVQNSSELQQKVQNMMMGQ